MAKDNGIVAWVTRHTKPDKHKNISWKIRAEIVEELDVDTWEEPAKKKVKSGGFGNFDSW